MNSEILYQENILDHYRNPRNFRKLERASASGHVFNALCGDDITVELHVYGKTGKVKEAAFTGKGCAISMASASMLIDTLKGKKIDEVNRICSRDVLDGLGIDVGPVRIKCAMVGLDALRTALKSIDCKKK